MQYNRLVDEPNIPLSFSLCPLEIITRNGYFSIIIMADDFIGSSRFVIRIDKSTRTAPNVKTCGRRVGSDDCANHYRKVGSAGWSLKYRTSEVSAELSVCIVRVYFRIFKSYNCVCLSLFNSIYSICATNRMHFRIQHLLNAALPAV